MGGRRRLSAGQVRMLGRHDGWRGLEYRREWAAHANGDALTGRVSLALARVCVRKVRWLTALRELHAAEDAQKRRRKVARPSDQAVERLRRREGLEDGSYQQALAAFEDLAVTMRRVPTPADLVARWRKREGTGA